MPQSTSEFYTLSLHDALPIYTVVFELPDSGGYLANGTAIDRARISSVLREVFARRDSAMRAVFVIDNPHRPWADRKSTRLNSSHANNSYAVFCLKKKSSLNDP